LGYWCCGATYRGNGICWKPIQQLTEERMTLCNMAIEAGGKNGTIAADETTVSMSALDR